MKNKKVKAIGIVLTAIMLISVSVAIAPAVSATGAGDLEEIRKAIEESGAEWQADYTSVSGLSLEEKQQLCGLKIRKSMKNQNLDSNIKTTEGNVPVKNQNFDSNAMTTEGLYPEEPKPPVAVPGDVITSWTASNTYVWGVGFDGSDVWISDALDIWDYEYTVTGTIISSFPTPWAGAWPADIAWDGTHLWQVNVGGDNCIYELDPANGNVLSSICDPAGIWDWISQRGLAYDAGTDTFYVGGWNEDIVYHIQGPSGANPGAIIDQFNFNYGISGLAFSPDGTLWIATCADPDMLYEVDPSTHTVINSFAHPEGGAYNGGGLACNNDGNLWMISQGTNTVYLVEGEEVCDTFDWRDYLGGDWTTPIRNQGPCGSCWAFGSQAAMEAHIDIQKNDPTFNQDLSEQQLLSCSPGDCTGWYEDAVLDWLRDEGTVDEACFPYLANDTIPCDNHCPDWESRIWKITDWGWVDATIPAITGHLHDAPLVTGMAVYEDFHYYDGGIYEHVSGDLLGYHLVSMVGYDECEDYWICKNSWGPGWGEEGWFRIRYGQCDIENMNAYIEPPIIEPQPEQPDIWVDPTSFDVTLPPDTIQDYTMKIGNDGEATLTYDINDVETTSVARESTDEGTKSSSSTRAKTSEPFAEMKEPVEYTCTAPSIYYKSDEPISVLLVSSDYPEAVSAVRDYLLAFDDIGVVDTFDAYEGTPSLGLLEEYDAVMVWSNIPFYDPVALGDVLADYIDVGGGVLATTPCWAGDPWGLQGRFITGGYSPFVSAGGGLFEWGDLGWYNDAHPIMTGVYEISGYWRGSASLAEGAELVAEWDDEWPFVGTKPQVVGATLLPGLYGSDDWTGDVPTLMHNALIWTTGPSEDCPWLDENPKSGSVPPGGYDEITVTIDTTGLECGGEYSCDIIIANNDRDENPTIVPVSLTIPCEKSDLVITGKWVCWPDNCTICYNVTNIGDGTAPACHNTTLYVDGVDVAHDHVPVDLAPGESYTGCFNGYEWGYTSPSDNITVCADNNDTLDELDENNNCLTNIWMCGDVNGDGKVTMSDVRKVFNRYLDPNYPLYLSWAADVNCDGKITMSDVRKVFNRYLDPSYALNCCCEEIR